MSDYIESPEDREKRKRNELRSELLKRVLLVLAACIFVATLAFIISIYAPVKWLSPSLSTPTPHIKVTTPQPTASTSQAVTTPVISSTVEPPEITAARITTVGAIIVGIIGLLGTLLGVFATIRSAHIISQASKK
jgi:hypothetical protein